jgi:hypothetical protein
MKRFTIDVPDSLHRRIKTECAKRGSRCAAGGLGARVSGVVKSYLRLIVYRPAARREPSDGRWCTFILVILLRSR